MVARSVTLCKYATLCRYRSTARLEFVPRHSVNCALVLYHILQHFGHYCSNVITGWILRDAPCARVRYDRESAAPSGSGMYTAWLRYTNTTEQYFTRGCVPTGADRNRIGDCGFDIRYAMGHVLLLSCCAPPLEVRALLPLTRSGGRRSARARPRARTETRTRGHSSRAARRCRPSGLGLGLGPGLGLGLVRASKG